MTDTTTKDAQDLLDSRAAKDAEDILELARNAHGEEKAAREKLAEVLSGPHLVSAHDIASFMQAQAKVVPWAYVLDGIERSGLTPTAAVRAVRERQRAELLERSETLSTSALTNEMRRVERDANREFLDDTRWYVS